MRNLTENFDIEDLMSIGDDLLNLVSVGNGFEVLSQSFNHLKSLSIACDDDFNQIQGSIQDCKKKLDACKKKTEETYSHVSSGDDIEHLQKELDEEMELECKLKDELRGVADELTDMNAQLSLIDEQRQSVKRKEREDLRAEKKLSMYASVSKIIPDIDDPSKISGYIVDREKRVVEKFQFEANKVTAYETCNNIWSIINKQ